MIGNAHIDPVWLWRWPEGFREVEASFRSAVARLEEYPDFLFTASSAAYYEWIERSDPELFEQIRAKIAEGRWELAGGWWVQPDCNLPSGESFVRQGLYGQRYFLEKFGRIARVGYNVDSFGHHAALPQILRKSGMDSYVFLRPAPHEKGLPGPLFWWESDDGSRVLAFRIVGEYRSGPEGLETQVRRCAAAGDPIGGALMCFYGVGDHGGGPTRMNIESIRRMQPGFSDVALVFSTPRRFFEQVLGQGARMPVVHDELQHHARGTYSVHSGVKRWNRRAENALRTAEKFAAIASMQGAFRYPHHDLARAWKSLLFNQFHDILAGTSIAAAYADARNGFGEAVSIAEHILHMALQTIVRSIARDSSDEERIVVFNPHPWESRVNIELESSPISERTELMDCSGGRIPLQLVQSESLIRSRCRLSFTATLPALGYRVFRLVSKRDEAPPVPGVKADDASMENEALRLELDRESGAIKRLYDKRAGVEVFGAPAAVGVVLDDPSDAWGHDVTHFDKAAGVFKAVSLKRAEHGPVKSVIRVESEYGRSRLVQEFTMYPERAYIEVRVTVDWREQFRALKLRFPVNLYFVRAVYDIPYGHIERAAYGDEQPGQSWLDVSGSGVASGEPYGLSLLNDGKYSFDVRLNDIELTVLRSPIYAHHDPARPDPAKGYEFLDQGLQQFRYALLPHQGGWEDSDAVRRAAELNSGPIAFYWKAAQGGSFPSEASFLSCEPRNVVVSVLKCAEDGEDLIVRAYETAKRPVHARIDLHCCSRSIEADFGACEIKTFRVPRDAAGEVPETDLLEVPLSD